MWKDASMVEPKADATAMLSVVLMENWMVVALVLTRAVSTVV